MICLLNVWHGRLGHVGMSYIKKNETLWGLKSNLFLYDVNKCEICIEFRYAKRRMNSVNAKVILLLQLIQSAVWDLKNKETKDKIKILHKADCSWYTILYSMLGWQVYS